MSNASRLAELQARAAFYDQSLAETRAGRLPVYAPENTDLGKVERSLTSELKRINSEIRKLETPPAKMRAEVRTEARAQPAPVRAAPAPLPPGTISASEYARLLATTRALGPGIVAGTREIANMAYQNSDKFLKDAKRVISQTANGNFTGAATRAAAKTAGGAALGGAMAQAANMRALTRLIPVIGQVAGAGMLGAEVGSGLYDVADTEIQDALAALTGTDPATGMRSETSPGQMLDKITQGAEEFIAQAREASAVTQGWERGIMPAGQKPMK